MKAATLYEDARLNMADSIRLTVESLNHYGAGRELVVTWSGGKDSTCLVTLLVHLVETGQVPRPSRLTVMYADTRMELTPLAAAAVAIAEDLREREWIDVRTVMAPLDHRFLVYILGRGVPPPNNNTLRWCQHQIKIDPMTRGLEALAVERGYGSIEGGKYRGTGAKFLTLIGLRLGESAARDSRIALSCGTNGAECGQGWYQQELPGSVTDKLSPILHWRVCHVWEWLKHWAPLPQFGDWSTQMIADAYGGEEAEEINARTGCVGCPLASKDTALETLLAQPRWGYLQPLTRLRGVFRALREPANRLRMPPGEKRADGTLCEKQNRMGPITMDARRWALGQVLDIQDEVNEAAAGLGMPMVDMLNAEETDRIRCLIAAGTWPRRWSGNEPRADEPFEEHPGEVLWPTVDGKAVRA